MECFRRRGQSSEDPLETESTGYCRQSEIECVEGEKRRQLMPITMISGHIEKIEKMMWATVCAKRRVEL